MHQKIKKACAVTMMGTLLAGSVPIYHGLAASKNLKVSSKSITLTVGKTKAITTNMSATFKTSNKKIVSLKNVKKKKCTLVAKKKGSCTITVKAKNQKTIKVKVKVKKKAATTTTTKPVATVKPTATIMPTAIVTPQETEMVTPTETPVVTGTVIEAEDTDTMGGKVNNLGYNLSKVLPEEKDGNRMIYSYSILMALTMLDNAAEGETKAEIEKVLGITDLSAWDEEFSIHLKNNCNDEIKDHETESEEEDERRWFRDSFFVPELSSANSLWYNDTRFSFDSEVQKEYMELLKDKFMAECRALDFSSSRNPVNDVNDWVAEKTNRKIQNILQGDLNPETAQAILVNTLYFNGCWKNIFNKELTSKAEFYGKEETTEVDMMRQVEENYSYYEEGGLRALELPFYGKNNLVMDVIIAEDNEQDVVSLYDKMSNTEKNRFYQALGNAEEKLVNMYLPKFKMEYGIGLDDYLRALGINQAFDSDGAEFPGLRGNNQENIYVDTVIHKSVIEVGEMGATAAAATVIGMAATSAMEPEDKPTPIEFKVDHPFVFVIRDKNTNMIYFMGQIENLSE